MTNRDERERTTRTAVEAANVSGSSCRGSNGIIKKWMQQTSISKITKRIP